MYVPTMVRQSNNGRFTVAGVLELSKLARLILSFLSTYKRWANDKYLTSITALSHTVTLPVSRVIWCVLLAQ